MITENHSLLYGIIMPNIMHFFMVYTVTVTIIYSNTVVVRFTVLLCLHDTKMITLSSQNTSAINRCR